MAKGDPAAAGRDAAMQHPDAAAHRAGGRLAARIRTELEAAGARSVTVGMVDAWWLVAAAPDWLATEQQGAPDWWLRVQAAWQCDAAATRGGDGQRRRVSGMVTASRTCTIHLVTGREMPPGVTVAMGRLLSTGGVDRIVAFTVEAMR